MCGWVENVLPKRVRQYKPLSVLGTLTADQKSSPFFFPHNIHNMQIISMKCYWNQNYKEFKNL